MIQDIDTLFSIIEKVHVNMYTVYDYSEKIQKELGFRDNELCYVISNYEDYDDMVRILFVENVDAKGRLSGLELYKLKDSPVVRKESGSKQ